ncbi:uncharacterized protein LOC124653206 isoform X2 [Lolium rigidum]|uniref:uncharacterized protein LOC124653206 isoform X2 n=1 Tax=Lolium rigidum TaxID=89674 RepID=UPI001F5DEBE5|nr:uncharacterized protein LOC124653206 isoform X2 [Lolium rigidum]
MVSPPHPPPLLAIPSQLQRIRPPPLTPRLPSPILPAPEQPTVPTLPALLARSSCAGAHVVSSGQQINLLARLLMIYPFHEMFKGKETKRKRSNANMGLDRPFSKDCVPPSIWPLRKGGEGDPRKR